MNNRTNVACFAFGFTIFFAGIEVAEAQMFINNGADVYISPDLLGDPTTPVIVNGGMVNSSSTKAGYLENNGDFWITRNSPEKPLNRGNVILEKGSTMRGNGNYHVEQDWINDAFFTADNSEVFLYGDLRQFIRGTKVTTFHDLTLTGSGFGEDMKKTLEIDARTNSTGHLALNDRELETQDHTIFVENSALDAVSKDNIQTGGFVSTGYHGQLARATLQDEIYLFPLGSSGGVPRYRPIEIKPKDKSINEYGARFANYDVNNDHFNTNVGAIPGIPDVYNLNFYHSVSRNQGNAVADISILYDPSSDGEYNGIAFYDNERKLWRDAMNTGPGPIRDFGFSSMTRTTWSFERLEDRHFILFNGGSGITDSIPNIFTPGNDGLNDVFHISNKNIKEYQIQIFNRWGLLLFEANAAQIDWDGRTLAGAEVPSGTYFYTLTAKKMNDEQITRNGFLQIIR